MLKCKFCAQTKKLVKSHVLPQALHNYVQDDDYVPMKIYAENRGWGNTSRTGVYGKFLCNYCENFVGKYDDYGISFIKKYAGGKTGKPLQGSFAEGFVADVDYKKLKLWILSVLWRADACDHEMFKRVDLGEKWRNQLTDRIRLGDPGGDDDFAVTATLFDEGVYGHAIMADPHRERHAGINWYRFYVYGGFTFFIKVDQQRQPENFALCTLRKAQPFIVLRRKFSQGERTRFAQSLNASP